MTLVDKPKNGTSKLKREVPSLESFEETYKTAYTHGLEMIYSLENVDLKTIRRIEENAPKQEENKKILDPEPPLEGKDPQLELDLGVGFRTWVEPYFLLEPIQVLGLSLQAESCLLEHGLKTLSELLAHNFRDYVFMKGMGQGHIDEVKKKLEKHIAGRSVKMTFLVDFQSLILSLSHGINFKRLSQFLKKYGLADAVPLTQSEKIEIKAFEYSKDEQWQKEVAAELMKEETKRALMLQLERIAKAFIIPWIDSRGGIATEDEIVERIEKVAKTKEKTSAYLKFLQDHFTDGRFPFSPFLREIEPEVFCTSERGETLYREIISKALSYFYRKEAVYPLQEMASFLLRGFCKEWKDCTSAAVFDCLFRSKQFEIYRAPCGALHIRLS